MGHDTEKSREELIRELEELRARLGAAGEDLYEERFRALVQNSSDLIVVLDGNGDCVYASPSITKILGYAPEDVIGLNAFKFLLPDNLESARELFNNCLAHPGMSFASETRYRHADGHIVHIEVIAKNHLDNPAIKGIIFNSRDITERVKAMEQARESQEYAKNIIDSSMDIIIAVDMNRRIIEYNRAAEEAFGHAKEEVLGRHIDLLYSSSDEGQDVHKKTIYNGRNIQEITNRRKDGSMFPALLTSSALRNHRGEIVGVMGISHDITDFRRALDALRESEARFRALAETTSGAIFIWQGEKYCYVNHAFQVLSGYSEQELLDMTYWHLSHPDYREWMQNLGQARLRGDSVPMRYELKVVTKSGQIKWADVTSTLILHNNRTAVLGTAFDITAHKKVEEDLRRKASELQAIFQVQPDLFLRLRHDGTILDCKPWKSSKIRIPAEDYIDRKLEDVLPDSLIEAAYEAIKEVRSSNGLVERLYTLPTEKTTYYFEARLLPLFNNELIAIVREITEKKKHEEELLKSQQLESIGILAGGIAHDFNNILAAIQGNISLAKLYSQDGSMAYRKLVDTERSIERAKELTYQLLTFSMGGAPLKKISSIYKLLKEAVSFYLSGSDTKCEFNIPTPLWLVEIDEGQISQVINNIIINSIQAMPHGGTITIEALNINTRKDRSIIAQHSFVIEPGDYVMISIEDQGIGIAPEYISRIFDPYFSLKENGTGLGLATSYSIIKRHNGYIDAKSEVGAGTTIFIYLPATKSEMPIELEPEPTDSPVRGSGRVLLMDDDETILAVCGELIRKMGYDTVLARDGRETLRIFEESLRNSEKIDAVIMDLVIPGGMGGKECIRELLKIDPSARVIVSSGYSNDPIVADYRKFGFRGVIAKPYRAEDLSRVLHTIINQPDLPRS